MADNIEYEEFMKQIRALGIGDITLHHDKLKDEPLGEEDWGEVWRATLAYQFHLRIIVARARARVTKEQMEKLGK